MNELVQVDDIKPTKRHFHRPAYRWVEIEEFIKLKYKRDVRDWEGKYHTENGSTIVDQTVDCHDFWKYILDDVQVEYDMYFYLPIVDNDRDTSWIREIKEILRIEFLDEERMYCFAE